MNREEELFDIPIIGDLFPKYFEQGMKKLDLYQIRIFGNDINTNKEEFNRIGKGQRIYVRKAVESDIYLGLDSI